jgi:DNA-binding NtrC family response regulator
VLTIEIPPLRERREDIKPLTDFFIKRFTERSHKQLKRISKEALNKLLRYEWPGNVRELENVIERAMVLCRGDLIESGDLPLKIETEKAYTGETMADIEKQHIRSVLLKTNWNLSLTAEKLGIHRNTLRLKIKEYGLEKEK